MQLEERKARMLSLGGAEEVYRRLYLSHPELYFYDQRGELFADWEGFCALYRRYAPDAALPDESPTLMNHILLEQNFFEGAGRDACVVINARYCPPFWHHLNFIKIMYVLNGEILINFGRENHMILRKGSFIISPPNIKQSVFSYHDDDIVINVFLRVTTFEQAFSSLLLESNELSPFFWKVLYGQDESNLIWFQMDTDGQLDAIICKMLDEFFSPRMGGNFYLVSLVMAFLSHALYFHRGVVSSIWGTQEQKSSLPKVMQYIHDHYSSVSLASLAEHFRLSEGYMSRYVKRETGYSLTCLLRNYRMKQAGRMLRDTRLPISQIMYDVGYTDISYFYKAFKAYYGMTPLEFRKKEKVIFL